MSPEYVILATRLKTYYSSEIFSKTLMFSEIMSVLR